VTAPQADPEPKIAASDGQAKTSQPSLAKEKPRTALKNDGTPTSAKLKRIRLESVPANATVTENLTEIGNAPLDVPFAPGVSERVLQLKLEGYVPKEIVLQADMVGTHTVTLAPIATGEPEKATKPDTGKRPDRRPVRKPPTPAKKDGKKTYDREIW
jgi:hypothetical protein